MLFGWSEPPRKFDDGAFGIVRDLERFRGAVDGNGIDQEWFREAKDADQKAELTACPSSSTCWERRAGFRGNRSLRSLWVIGSARAGVR